MSVGLKLECSNRLIFIVSFLGAHRTVPVCQMLTQSQDANSIRSWLTFCFTDMKKPREVIIDASEALISACVQAFSECPNTITYLNTCMNALLNKGNSPPSLIRIDRSHFVRSVVANKHLKNVDSRVSRLIKGLIGYFIKCVSLEDTEIILRKLFTLMKNEYVSEEVSSAKAYLVELIKTHNIINENLASTTETKSEEITRTAEKITYKDTVIYKWIIAIYDSVKPTIHSEADSVENVYYTDKLNNYLMELFSRLPMWSNLMCPIFKSTNYNPSSSGSESEFKNLKRLAGIKTQRVDVFVSSHLKLISGNMKM